MDDNKFYKNSQLIHSIPANTKRQLADIHMNVHINYEITLINAIQETKTVTAFN